MSIGAALSFLESQPRHGYPSHSILLNRFPPYASPALDENGYRQDLVLLLVGPSGRPKKEGLNQLPLETNLTMGCLPHQLFQFPLNKSVSTASTCLQRAFVCAASVHINDGPYIPVPSQHKHGTLRRLLQEEVCSSMGSSNLCNKCRRHPALGTTWRIRLGHAYACVFVVQACVRICISLHTRFSHLTLEWQISERAPWSSIFIMATANKDQTLSRESPP